MKVTIYGLRNKDGVFEYVGMTKNPHRRKLQHKPKGLEFVVICEVESKRARVFEKQVIQGAIREGHPLKNIISRS